MARVLLEAVNKIYHGTVPVKKSWYEFWKPSTKKAEVHVVKGVNLDIRDGEFLVLVGASGCGKSTTLRMVAGLEDISDGKIFIGETLVNDLSPKDRDIAMVFQNYALYPHMNVFENMAFGLRLRKMPQDEIQKRVNEAAALLKLEPLLHRKPKELSGGQRQRVAMGRAIVRRPKVYLMDEPLSNLDAKLRVQMRAELQKLHQTLGVTTIYVTHDQTEAMTLGDRIVVMHNGIVQQNDTPLNIYERPANQYVAGFIGSPPMNFLKASMVKKDDGLWIKAVGFEIKVADSKVDILQPYAGREVTVGIRAEDLMDRAFARDASPANTIKATVEVLEPLGSEVYLYVSTGGENPMVARVDAHTSAKVGETIELAINMKNVHVFDRETEACITSQASPAPVGAA